VESDVKSQIVEYMTELAREMYPNEVFSYENERYASKCVIVSLVNDTSRNSVAYIEDDGRVSILLPTSKKTDDYVTAEVDFADEAGIKSMMAEIIDEIKRHNNLHQ